jgi:isopenicillin-N N-acyltransferase-like protein
MELFNQQGVKNLQGGMMSNRKLPMYEIHGNHEEMGEQLGEACREQTRIGIANTRQLLQEAYDFLHLTWEGAQIQARKYMPFAEERYPQYVDELKGIARGANVDYDDICVLNAIEAVSQDALHLTKCTSMAVNQERTANDHVLISHNEDWLPEDEDDVYVVLAHPDDEPSFLAMSYGGLLPNVGFNSEGIAQCCDSVYPTDTRIGIPRLIVSRAVLAARSLSEAIQCTLVPHRAAGYNHLLAHESGEIYSVEVSAHRFAVFYGKDGYLVHTNHYIDPKMLEVERDSDELISTRVRYNRAERLIRQTPKHTIKTLQAIQMDHINFPNSICNHAVDGNAMDRENTITALLIDLTDRQMLASWGNPCMNTYHAYSLTT